MKPTNTVTISFESGTSREEQIQYIENVRKSLKGKMPDAEIDNMVRTFIENLQSAITQCDSCGEELTEQEKQALNFNYTFSCRVCGLKFDLCYECLEPDPHYWISRDECPLGFGCRANPSEEGVKTSRGAFIPRDFKLEQYEKCSDARQVTFDTKRLANKLAECFEQLAGFFYVRDKNVPKELLEDLWTHFRTTNPKAVAAYGKPENPMEELAPNWKVYKVYEQFSYLLEIFISLDDGVGPLLLTVRYPNEDLFIINRVYGRERKKLRCPFVTLFLKGSEFRDSEKSYHELIEACEDQIKEILKMTVDEAFENGKILTVSFYRSRKYLKEYLNSLRG